MFLVVDEVLDVPLVVIEAEGPFNVIGVCLFLDHSDVSSCVHLIEVDFLFQGLFIINFFVFLFLLDRWRVFLAALRSFFLRLLLVFCPALRISLLLRQFRLFFQL